MKLYSSNHSNLFISLLFASCLTACGGSSNGKSNEPIQQNNTPTIKLIGESSTTLSYTKPYQELGAIAKDIEDGTLDVSISGNVDNEIGEYIVTYTATDSRGLSVSVKRTVNVIDDIAPQIVLNEADTVISIQEGYTYLEPGAVATDEIDGETTVEESSNINNLVPGEYHVTYTATDSKGNKAVEQRQVFVTPIKHRLEISFFGEGNFELNNSSPSLTCNERLCYTYIEQGTSLEIAAKAGTDYEFSKWSNCDNVVGNICSIISNSPRVIDAQFVSKRPLEVASNVIVLTDSQVSQIANYNADTGLVTFSADIDTNQFNVNDIIVSKGIFTSVNDPDNIDIYFARRISQITGLIGAPKFVETTEVSLEDIILDGTISIDEAFTINDVVPNSLPQGITIKQKKASYPNRVNSAPARDVRIPLDIDVPIDENITVKGNVTLSIDPNINLDFSLTDGLKEFRTIVTTDVSGSLAIELKDELPLKQFKKAIGNPIRLAPVTIGPVVFIPEIQIYIELNAKFEATLTSTATLSASVTGGAHYLKSAGWKTVHSSKLSNNMTLPQIEAKGNIEIGPSIDLGILVYGITGPVVGANIHAGGEIYPLLNNDSSQCAWNYNIYLGGKGTFKGVFKLLKKSLKYEATLFNTKRVINTREVDCDVQPPQIPLNLEAKNISQQEINLEWEYPEDPATVTFDIYRDFSPVASKVKDLNFTDSGLSEDTNYCYTLVAVNSNGDRSHESNAICIKTDRLDTNAPEIPMNLVAKELSTTAIKLNWNEVIENDEITYVIYNTDYANPIATSSSTTFEALNLLSDKEYCFQATAVDASGNESAKSNISCATTLPPEFANWTMSFGCLNRVPLVNVPVELNLDSTNRISYVGNTVDYDGQTPFVFALSGVYDVDKKEVDGQITSTFERTSGIRVDTFIADVSSGDSGKVAMNKITEYGGCNAEIRFIESNGTTKSNIIKPSNVRESNLSHFRGF